MSDPSPGDIPPPASVAPRRRNPVLAAFMLIVGIILLLPGLCSIAFIGFAISSKAGTDAFTPLVPLWLFCFVVSAVGLFLIIRVFR